MAKIKHIAIASQDPDKTAEFFKEVFDLEEVGKVDSANATGYYLSDGNINMAILNFHSEILATTSTKPCTLEWAAATAE